MLPSARLTTFCSTTADDFNRFRSFLNIFIHSAYRGPSNQNEKQARDFDKIIMESDRETPNCAEKQRIDVNSFHPILPIRPPASAAAIPITKIWRKSHRSLPILPPAMATKTAARKRKPMNTIQRAVGIQIGVSTQSHDQAMICVSFNAMNSNVSKPKNPIPMITPLLSSVEFPGEFESPWQLLDHQGSTVLPCR
jgi:hypothetical protein